MTKWPLRIVLAGAGLALLMGHDGHGCHGCEDSEPIFGPPTQSTCPPTSTLTYNNFGKSFMERYCTECHDSDLVGDDRQGAPTFHDFDSLYGIKAVSNHIDETTAAGPAAVNDGMPQDDPKPTLDERYQLGEWIACGMPE
ncbi:MAG: hypothetical protein AB7O24_08625 [Kofleriaceae bacterium]